MNNTKTQLHRGPQGEQVKKPGLLRCQISLSWKMLLLTAIFYMLEVVPRLGTSASKTTFLNLQLYFTANIESPAPCRAKGGWQQCLTQLLHLPLPSATWKLLELWCLNFILSDFKQKLGADTVFAKPAASLARIMSLLVPCWNTVAYWLKRINKRNWKTLHLMPMHFYWRIIMKFLAFQSVILLDPAWRLFLYHYTQIYTTKR